VPLRHPLHQIQRDRRLHHRRGQQLQPLGQHRFQQEIAFFLLPQNFQCDGTNGQRAGTWPIYEISLIMK